MSQPQGLVERVETAILPLLEHEGYELVLLEYVPRGRVLRLYIDHANGVSLDDCSRVSRIVSDLMDGEGLTDAFEDRFTLEVSSPGLDRPLVRPKDFQRFVGRKVKLTTREALEGRRKFSGELLEAGAEGIRLDIDGKGCSIKYDAIERARLVPEF